MADHSDEEEATMTSQGNGHSSSQSRRPPLGSRASSSSEHRRNGHGSGESPPPTSPTGAHKSHHRPHTRQHVVGHARAHTTRVPSYGKNLNKHGGEVTTTTTKHHRRSHSHTPSTSPRAHQSKRTSSNVSLPRTGSKVSLKSNSSKTNLVRHGGAVTPTKQTSMQRPLPQPGRSERTAKIAVRFDLGSEDQDASWTEASTSESPNHTRTKSVQSPAKNRKGGQQEPPEPERSPRIRNGATTSDQPVGAWTNGSNSRKNSTTTPPQPELITSRLLQPRPPHNAPPQMSTLSATATPGNRSPTSSSQGQSFTNGTPGMQENVVSRFIGGSADTHGRSSVSTGKTMYNASTRDTEGQTPENGESSMSLPSQKALELKYSASRANRPPISSYNHPPSRTQQKLWLQRASSNIEPQQLAPSTGINGIPTIRTNSNGIGTLVSGYSDSRDPRLQREFERTGLEYLVVRRYRNPVVDSISRLAELPGAQKNKKIPPQFSRGYMNGGDGPMGLSQSLRERGGWENVGPGVTNGNRKGIEGVRGTRDDSGVSRRDSQGPERDSDEVDQILRRMWDRVDMSGGE